MTLEHAIASLPWPMLLLGALSLSIGWGIRGNFGHEYGAALPGVLASLAVILASNRPDWYAHAPYVAMFGALGWSFGGSMSYMQVIGYTHSGHPLTTLYGYANLFTIGFLWASLGGGGAVLPLLITNKQLTLLFAPILTAVAGWSLQAVLVDWFFQKHRMRRQESPLYWNDTDWVAALVAIASALLIAIVRGGFDIGTWLVLDLALGWFLAFLILVNVFKLRMTPPRGDNWAGCVGLTAGFLLFAWHHNLNGVIFVTLLTGIFGGLAFSGGQMIKLLWIKTGWQTNWHSVMEQTQGFIFGLGFTITLGAFAFIAPSVATDPLPSWTLPLALAFVFIGINYLNHRKSSLTWVEHVQTLTERPLGLPVAGWLRQSQGWFGWIELFYLAITLVLCYTLYHHKTHPIALIPDTALGKGQLLYLIFLWGIIVINFKRAIVTFAPHRLITEGLVTLNAIVCTFLVLTLLSNPLSIHSGSVTPWIEQSFWIGFFVSAILLLVFFALTFVLFGKQHIPNAGLHIRFGPNANATKAKPSAGHEHP